MGEIQRRVKGARFKAKEAKKAEDGGKIEAIEGLNDGETSVKSFDASVQESV